MKVLLVDDDPNLRKIGRISLERGAGWQVVLAESGPEALELAGKDTLDVILLDIMMPGMDGIATFNELKERAPSIPVIFMTAKAQSHELDSYRQLGVAGVICKPFDPMTLPGEISDILGLS